MRFVYMDESGFSARESLIVVAGVIIHADSECVPVEQFVRGLLDKYVYEEDRGGLVFHATDLYYGGGPVFKNHGKYPIEKSREVLKELLSIPSRFQLPVVCGFTRKEKLSQQAAKTVRRESISFDHANAFSLCATAAERFMRRYAPGEVATVTAENNTQTRKTIDLMHDAFRGVQPRYTQWVRKRSFDLGLPDDFYPLTRLRDAVHFVEKSGGFLLQVADVCAWIISCHLKEKPGIEEFFKAFIPRGEAMVSIKGVRANTAGLIDIRCWD